MAEEIQNLVERIRQSPATIGETRIITIDGPAGSGKTTLSHALSGFLPECEIIHMDDLYEGWESTLTPSLSEKLLSLFTCAADSGRISYRPYDWHKGSLREEVEFPLPSFLILEGVGSGQRAIRDFASFSIWIWAPKELRLARGLERDGVELKEEWLKFQILEEKHFMNEETERAADYAMSGAPSGADRP